MKHINKPAMTLALLLAAATGAWAQGTIEVTRTAGQNQWTFTMPAQKVELTPTYYPRAVFSQLPAALVGIPAGNADAIVSAGESAQGTVKYFVTANANATAPAIGDGAWSTALPTAAVITSDVSEGATAYVYYYIAGNDGTEENTYSNSLVQGPLSVTLLKNLYTATFTPKNVLTILGGKATVAVGGQAPSLGDAEAIGSLKQGQSISITAAAGYTVGTVTLNGNDAEATYTEGSTVAKFAMPQADATVAYTLQRSMSTDMTVQMGDGSTGLSYTIEKNENGIWVPEEMTRAQLLGRFAVTDNKAGAPKTTLTLGEDYDVQLYKINESGSVVGSPIASAQFDFAPGRYAMKAVTLGRSSMYSGETALSNTFTLAATNLPGDIPIGGKRDGVVDADDVDNFFNLMFNNQLPDSSDKTYVLFDVNNDGEVDIADLQGIANIANGLNWDGSVPQNNARRFNGKASHETDKK